MASFQRDGSRIVYLDEGAGEARSDNVLLLLHAFPLTSAMFRQQVFDLTRGPGAVRIVAPDQRGFGGSELPPGQSVTTMEALAADALALLDHLEIERAVVGGVSMGGYAALALARSAPTRVRALVLMDTQASADDAARKAQREETAARLLEQGVGLLETTLLPKMLAPEAPPELREEVLAMLRQNQPDGLAAALRGMAQRTDTHDVLARFEGLVVVGDQDELAPLPRAEKTKRALGVGDLEIVPHAGHLANLENPEIVNSAIRRLFDRL